MSADYLRRRWYSWASALPQIAQYHPRWRIYEYAIDMSQAFDPSGHKLTFSKPAGNGEDFIDNLQGDPVEGFRIWRVPRSSHGP